MNALRPWCTGVRGSVRAHSLTQFIHHDPPFCPFLPLLSLSAPFIFLRPGLFRLPLSHAAPYTIQNRSKILKVGAWVRCKRAGLYKGDLGKVIDMGDRDSDKYIVQFVPRIDLQSFRLTPKEARERAKRQRPVQRFFNKDEVTKYGAEIEERRFGAFTDTMAWLRGEYYDPNGFCVKDLSSKSLIIDGAKPTITGESY